MLLLLIHPFMTMQRAEMNFIRGRTMNRSGFIVILSILFLSILFMQSVTMCIAQEDSQRNQQDIRNRHYLTTRAPLAAVPYAELPLGTIQPRGWLREQLVLMSKGMTGRLDELYPLVCGPRNGWLGGDGDGWERGPYWIDGLLPLAYLLEDEELIAKVKPWVEWSLHNQREDGFFGPIPFEEEPEPEPGIQKGPREDWWPKMVMLKVLQQYYTATGDQRVIDLMLKYFRYQLQELPERPLGHYTFWGNRRGGDNLMVVYWLYNITGEEFLLELAELLYQQTYDWTDHFLNQDTLSRQNTVHCVNLAQGIKQPIIYFQQHPEQKYIDAVKKAFRDIRKYHGQPQGMYGADEPLHGTNPTQGSEFCTAIELMFSLEQMIAITGDVEFADHLEQVAFNAVPTQARDDYMGRQYYQQANQVLLTRGHRHFSTDDGTRLVYGVLSGYPCCTTNMHQGLPKFTQHLWYASADDGLAALVYSPSAVKAKVADGQEVRIIEETNYPFEEQIRFTIETENEVEFPLHLRVPSWCRKASITINGETHSEPEAGRIEVIRRVWRNGDRVELTLPMHIFTTGPWHENSVSIQRGPLVYALRIGEEWKWVENKDYAGDYWEVYPTDPWNYCLLERVIRDPENQIQVVKSDTIAANPWNPENAPIQLKLLAKELPEWTLYKEMAGPMPPSPLQYSLKEQPETEITLIPYGCTTLRITEFPWARE
jgi:DUF1680 family protein